MSRDQIFNKGDSYKGAYARTENSSASSIQSVVSDRMAQVTHVEPNAKVIATASFVLFEICSSATMKAGIAPNVISVKTPKAA